jgi:hypothetical protein
MFHFKLICFTPKTLLQDKNLNLNLISKITPLLNNLKYTTKTLYAVAADQYIICDVSSSKAKILVIGCNFFATILYFSLMKL